MSLKLWGQNPWDKRNQSMNSDLAQSAAIQHFMFKAARKSDPARFPELGIENRPMDSDRAQSVAVRQFMFNAAQESDPAALPGLRSRDP
ncbi:hypothetical protein Taro_010337 [Colocasia esculenta]|uniref:Uncharacterized protein n=1 Tax=Colocasia esculenta TaxID=4460 RepID=A0A843TYM0_COLES|nr:hypothetical protein [Colocasia esculenta]